MLSSFSSKQHTRANFGPECRTATDRVQPDSTHCKHTQHTLTHAVLSLQQPLGLSVLTGRHVLVFNPALTAHNEIVRLCGSVIRAEPILSFSRARGWRDANCKAANLTSGTLQPRKYAKSRLFDLNTPGVSRQGL